MDFIPPAFLLAWRVLYIGASSSSKKDNAMKLIIAYIKPEQLGAFATGLRELGAKI